MGRHRHTMGNDWGGRAAANPAGAPRVGRQEVVSAAAAAGVEVKRDRGGWTLWWVRRPGDVWRVLESTNFLARESLLREGLEKRGAGQCVGSDGPTQGGQAASLPTGSAGEQR